MRIEWLSGARDDLGRLHAFLASKSPAAADRVIARLVEAPNQLVDFPRLGARVPSMDREVRRLIVGQYEVRYDILDDAVRIIRIFHTKEDR